jgi:hypothetical protein
MNHGAEGGFELRYHIDNTQLIYSTSGLKAQIPHNPASIVRLLYGERAQKRKTAPKRFSQSCQQQFDIRPSYRSRPPFENAWNGERASKTRFRIW